MDVLLMAAAGFIHIFVGSYLLAASTDALHQRMKDAVATKPMDTMDPLLRAHLLAHAMRGFEEAMMEGEKKQHDTKMEDPKNKESSETINLI